MAAALVGTAIALFIVDDYQQPANFLRYRLAQNLHAGHGLVYNPGANTLLTFSPLPVLPLSLAPDSAQEIAAAVWVLAYALSGGLLALLLHRYDLSQREILAALTIWLLAWPVWMGFRSPAVYAFLPGLLALIFLDTRRPRLAGAAAGIAPLCAPSGFVTLIASGIQATRSEGTSRYWQIAWIPVALWAAAALFIYGSTGLEGLALRDAALDGQWQDALWIALFIVAGIALTRRPPDTRVWIFPLWAALDVTAELLVAGRLVPIESPALGITVAVAIVVMTRNLPAAIWLRYGAAVLMAALLLVASPQTDNTIEDDRTVAQQIDIPPGAVLLHDGGDALPYFIDGFQGAAYRFDGQRAPSLESMARRNDHHSMIAALAPDYLLLTHSTVDLDAPGIAALDYTPVTEILWERGADISDFGATQSLDISYSPDIQLTGYAIDRQRPEPGDVLRLRLDWQFVRLPEEDITLNISLLDIDNDPTVTIFPQFAREVWTQQTLSTYHALRVPTEAQPGVRQIQVSVDYRAAIIGRASPGRVMIPFPVVTPPESPPLATLGPLTLHDAAIARENGDLVLTLTWRTSAPLPLDYRVFAHLTPLESLEPITQDDGLPLGGRYPTDLWQSGEVIVDTRRIPLENVASGEYHINLGFYTPEAGRLRDESGDFVRAIRVAIDENGAVSIVE